MNLKALAKIAPLVTVAAAGCASNPLVAPEAPSALRPPAGQVLVAEVPAKGVQIYECAAAKDAARYEWSFRGPEAVLLDRSGRVVGKHYGGPTWEALDGSLIVGDVRARDNGTDAGAIPWLLLGARSTGPEGSFSRVRSIQRLETVGGKAPSEPCAREQATKVARVPYTATYYFYAEASVAGRK